MQRFSVLDALRGLFAVSIVFFHMKDYNWVTNNRLVNNSDLAVSFFFVLSGLVIAFVYYDRINSKTGLDGFIRNRFRRLYPLHLYTLLVFAVFELSKELLYRHGYFDHLEPSNNNVRTFLSNLFLLNAVQFGGAYKLSWNYPSWSISAEFITYIIFALLLYLLRKNSRLKFYLVCIIPFALIIISQVISSLIFDAVYGFFIGVIVYRLRVKYQFLTGISRYLGTFLEIAACTATITMICNKSIFINYLYIYSFLFALNIYLFSFETGLVSSFLKKSFFQMLGKYSYSIYLNHAIVIEVVNFMLVRLFKLQGVLLYIVPFVILIVTVLYSALTYRYIETRFYKRMR